LKTLPEEMNEGKKDRVENVRQSWPVIINVTRG